MNNLPGRHLRSHGPLPEDPDRRTSLGRGRGTRQNQGVRDPGSVASTSSHGLNEQQRLELRQQLANQNSTRIVQNPGNSHQNQQTAPPEQAFGNDRQRNEHFESFEDSDSNNLSQDRLTPSLRQWIDLVDTQTRRLNVMIDNQVEENRQNRARIEDLTRQLNEVPPAGTYRQSFSPINWEASQFQLRRSTAYPGGNGLGRGEHVNVTRPIETSAPLTTSQQQAPLQSQNTRQNVQWQNNLQNSGGRTSQAGNPNTSGPLSFPEDLGGFSQAGNPNATGFYSSAPLQRQLGGYDRWKNIKDSFQMAGLYFPQPGLSANDFVNALEARATREGWTEAELLKVVSYTLKGHAGRWVDTSYGRWSNFAQFKEQFRKAFGSSATDQQLIMEITRTKMIPGENATEFVLKIQQKYQSMMSPPSVEEQVTCIRNHLTDDLRTLVFARQVSTYEELLNALHEASRCLDEANIPTSGPKTNKPADKPRFGLVQLRQEDLAETIASSDSMEFLKPVDQEVILPGLNAVVPPGAVVYDNRYGVQRRVNNPNYGFVAGQPRYPAYRPRAPFNPQQQAQRATVQPTFVVPAQDLGYSQGLTFNRSIKPCYNCGIPGHVFDVCENPRREVCNFCFGIGHTRHACPSLVSGVEAGQGVQVIESQKQPEQAASSTSENQTKN